LNSDIVLRTQGLSKRFGRRFVINDLNLEVYRGDVFGFLGPNAAGKSITIRMLLGLVKPTSGEIELFGHSLQKSPKKALAKIGGIVEKPDFYLYLSARRNLEILGALSGGVNKEKNAQVLALVGLTDRAKDKVKTFSHGMKQRLGIAQALLSDPDLVVFDEPTSGLDPQGMKEVRELIVRLSQEQGITVFLSSHLLHEIEQVATRMAIINRGELMVQGDVKKLLGGLEDAVLLRVAPLERAADLLRKQTWISSISVNGDSLKVTLPHSLVPRMNALLVENRIEVSAMVPRRLLEDYFLSITGEA